MGAYMDYYGSLSIFLFACRLSFYRNFPRQVKLMKIFQENYR